MRKNNPSKGSCLDSRCYVIQAGRGDLYLWLHPIYDKEKLFFLVSTESILLWMISYLDIWTPEVMRILSTLRKMENIVQNGAVSHRSIKAFHM